MSKFIDLAGQRFGKLTVLERVQRQGTFFRCKCDCGNEITASSANLRTGHTQSCGCLQVERNRAAHYKHGHTAGDTASTEYRSWQQMRIRCFDVNSAAYPRYGGRGITVCERWKDSFENFLADMGHKPSADHSLDRIDSNGNYEPSNCRWATSKEQANNRNRRRWAKRPAK